LAVLGGAGLLAFLLAGYLIARAASRPNLLEPALAAALSLVTILALAGVTTPVAFAIALAATPAALVLACAGAWVGMDR
jgi:Flp pilus assembly protein TadB